jgi:glucose-1-phosphate adenylyltransferase
LFEIASTAAEYILILAGDHLYRMDYSAMTRFHWDTKADITVAVQPVTQKDVCRFGILKRDENHRITEFYEKPTDPQVISTLASSGNPDKPYLGSMGIYLFNKSILFDLLQSYSFDDFGGHVLPYAITNHSVFGFDYNGYWEDIGTIRSFYETNLALTLPDPPFNLYEADHPIYTHARFLPGSRVKDSRLQDVLLAEGCQIDGAEICHSVVGLRSQIGAGTYIKDSILMGADYYAINCPDVPMGIGSNCKIEGAIIDKNARIGDRTIIQSFPRGTDIDTDTWVVRDGIVVIPKDTVLLPGTVIRPEAGKY